MANSANGGYSLNVQLALQAPTNANVQAVVSQLQRQLNGATAQINPVLNQRAAAQVRAQLQQLGATSRATAVSASQLAVAQGGVATSQMAANLKKHGTAVNNLGKSYQSLAGHVGSAGVQLSSYFLTTAIIVGIRRLIKETVELEKTILQLQQVSGRSEASLTGLRETILSVSSSTGVAATDLAAATKTLAQAGNSLQTIEKLLPTLALAQLTSSFDSLDDTVEASVAILAQFGQQAKETGDEAQFVIEALDDINTLSKTYAVESGDLLTNIRRAGGAWSALGASIEELNAIFTTVRSTTRETSETISVGLRTLAVRLARITTANQLAEIGVQARDAEGQLRPLLDILKDTALTLAEFGEGDVRTTATIEALGGARQFSRILPIIQNFSKAQEALNLQIEESGSIASDAEIALSGVGRRMSQIAERYQNAFNDLSESDGFRNLTTDALRLTNSLVGVVGGLEQVIALLPLLAGLGIAGNLTSSFLGGNLSKLTPQLTLLTTAVTAAAIASTSYSEETKKAAISAVTAGGIVATFGVQVTNGIVASIANTNAKNAETAATAAAAGATSAFAVTMNVLAVGIGIATGAVVYFAQQAQQRADALAQARDEELADVRRGESDFAVGVGETSVKAAREDAESDAAIRSLIVGIPATIIGGIAGFFALGGPTGAAVGAGSGIGTGIIAYNDRLDELNAQIDASVNFINLLANAASASARAVYELGDASTEIQSLLAERETASEPRRLQIDAELETQRQRIQTQTQSLAAQESSAIVARDQLSVIAQDQGTTISGINTGSLSPEIQQRVALSQQLLDDYNKALKTATEAQRSNLAAVADEVLDGSNFGQILADATNPFTIALRQTTAVIRQEYRNRLDKLATDLEAAQTDEEREQIQQRINATIEGEQRALDSLIETYDDQNSIIAANNELQRKQAALLAKINSIYASLAQVGDAAASALFAIGAGPAQATNSGDVAIMADRTGFAMAESLSDQIGGLNTLTANAQGLIGQEIGGDTDISTILDDLNVPFVLRDILLDSFLEAFADSPTITREVLEQALEPVDGFRDEMFERIKQLEQFRQKESQLLTNFYSAINDAAENVRSATRTRRQAQQERDRRVAEARGERFRPALPDFDIDAVADRLERNTRLLGTLQNNPLQGPKGPIQLGLEAGLEDSLAKDREALKEHSEALKTEASFIEEDIRTAKNARLNVADIIEDFITGSNEERFNINRAGAATQAALATGSVQQFDPDTRKAVFSLLDRLADVEVAPGVTGRQASEQLIMNDAARLGINPQFARALFSPSTEEERLAQELDKVLTKNVQIQAAIEQAAIAEQQQLVKALNGLNATLQQQRQNIEQQQAPQFQLASGGAVHGGGTSTSDSIPAMLSNGEFVINAKAARQLGYNNLNLMNQGKKPRYAAVGGFTMEELSQPVPEQPSESKQSGPSLYQQEMSNRREAYQTMMADRRKNYQETMAKRREFYSTEEGRIAMGRQGLMAAAQTQNRYNSRAASFNNSIAQSQMAFRQQAARYVGAGALQGAGGGVLTGGSGRNLFASVGRGITASQQNANQQNAVANNAAGGQTMNHNHNHTISGMISVGGISSQAIAQAVTQHVEGLVVSTVDRMMKQNKGFQAGT